MVSLLLRFHKYIKTKLCLPLLHIWQCLSFATFSHISIFLTYILLIFSIWSFSSVQHLRAFIPFILMSFWCPLHALFIKLGLTAFNATQLAFCHFFSLYSLINSIFFIYLFIFLIPSFFFISYLIICFFPISLEHTVKYIFPGWPCKKKFSVALPEMSSFIPHTKSKYC